MMMHSAYSVLLFAFALHGFSQNQAKPDAPSPRVTIQQELGFERQAEGDSAPTGWYGGPEGTRFADREVVHSGKWSVRLDRDSKSPSTFSVITRNIPMDFAGSTIELRGFLRLKDVTGFAGLWMREDGETTNLQFTNMQEQQVKGTNDWTEYSIRLPLEPLAQKLFFGVLVTDTGTLWADDLQLLVDGKPIAEAKPVERTLTVLDTDHEFDKGSRIAIASLSPLQVENLVTLGRVWGFLKYHHPAITSGKRHWDYELFRILPAILAAPDRAKANEALVAWIDSLGDLPACNPCASGPSGDLDIKPDLAWIHDAETLGRPLSLHLQRIYDSRPSNSQFYLSLMPGVGNPSFNHEPIYPNVKFPDPGYQLLALYRWWNVLQYWAPYRETAGQNWPQVLAEFVPKLALARDREAYELAMMELIAKANDTHANLWSSLAVRPPVGACGLPATLRFIDGQPSVMSVANRSDASQQLEVGDILDQLDGVPLAKLIADWSPFYADSNGAARQRDMANQFTNGPCGAVSATVRRGGQSVSLSLARVKVDAQYVRWHDQPGDTFRLLSPDVAYLKLSSIKASDVAGYMEKAKDAKGLIVDLRNYPSDFMPFVLGPFLVTRPTPFATFSTADLSNPGAFQFGNAIAIQPGPVHYGGKVVILVDEVSQSSAEYTTMALRAAPNAMVVGSTTAGADGNISRIPLPGGLHTLISGIGVFYPNHAPTQRMGIVPDVEARPTLTGTKAGRDEVLEVGIRQILGPEASQADVERMARPDATPYAVPASLAK